MSEEREGVPTLTVRQRRTRLAELAVVAASPSMGTPANRAARRARERAAARALKANGR